MIAFLAIAFCLQAIIFIGTEFENKTQLALMISIIISIISHFVGTLLPIEDYKHVEGYVGYSASVFFENLFPDKNSSHTFIEIFGI